MPQLHPTLLFLAYSLHLISEAPSGGGSLRSVWIVALSFFAALSAQASAECADIWNAIDSGDNIIAFPQRERVTPVQNPNDSLPVGVHMTVNGKRVLSYAGYRPSPAELVRIEAFDRRISEKMLASFKEADVRERILWLQEAKRKVQGDLQALTANDWVMLFHEFGFTQAIAVRLAERWNPPAKSDELLAEVQELVRLMDEGGLVQKLNELGLEIDPGNAAPLLQKPLSKNVREALESLRAKSEVDLQDLETVKKFDQLYTNRFHQILLNYSARKKSLTKLDSTLGSLIQALEALRNLPGLKSTDLEPAQGLLSLTRQVLSEQHTPYSIAILARSPFTKDKLLAQALTAKLEKLRILEHYVSNSGLLLIPSDR